MNQNPCNRPVSHFLAAASVLLPFFGLVASGDDGAAKTIFTSEAGKIAQKQVDGLSKRYAVVKDICDSLGLKNDKGGEFAKAVTDEKAKEGWEKTAGMSVDDWNRQTKELSEGLDKDLDKEPELDDTFIDRLLSGLIHGIGKDKKVTAYLGGFIEINDYISYVSESSAPVTDLSAGEGSGMAGAGETKAKSIFRLVRKNNQNGNQKKKKP